MIQPVDRNGAPERVMRGSDQRSGSLFSYVDLESRVRGDHPLRPIREIVNRALLALSADFEASCPAKVRQKPRRNGKYAGGACSSAGARSRPA